MDKVQHTSALTSEIARLVPETNDTNVIQPAAIGQGPWRNELLLFAKPEIFLVEQTEQVEKTLDLIIQKLAEFDAHIDGVAVVGGKVLDEKEIMSRHYGLINRLSRSASQMLDESEQKKVTDALGVAAGEHAILGGHEYLAQYPDETGADLDRLWFEDKSTKIRSGFYVRATQKGDRKIILVNAFHPEQLAHFTRQSHRIVLFLIHSNTDWAILRDKMIGGTFPEKADQHSIRGMLYANPQQFGFETVSIANNGVHLSAGPFEAMFEIANFFGNILGLDLEKQPPLLLRRMLAQGIALPQALKALDNPIALHDPKPIDLFTATEDLDTEKAIDFWQQHMTS